MKSKALQLVINILALLGVIASVFLLYLFLIKGWERYYLGYAIAGALIIFSLIAMLYFYKHSTRWVAMLLLVLCFLGGSSAAYAIYQAQHALRITLVNTTNFPVEKVKLSGCQSEELEDIPAKGSITVWVTTQDCSLSLSYTNQSNMYIRTLFNKVDAASQGNKLVYRIGKEMRSFDDPRPPIQKKKKKGQAQPKAD